jgi:hypothetical protein
MLLVLISLGTLFFECLVTIASLFLPPRLRVVMVVASVGLHMGIAAMQSLVIGCAFLPNIAGYWLGFAGMGTDLFTPAWWVAVSIVMASVGTLVIRKGVPVPEDWPVSPIALFAWSHRQWESLFARFAEGKTRIVLCTDGEKCLPGTLVLSKWGTSAAGGVGECPSVEIFPRGKTGCVYDGWEQCIGETLVFPPVLKAVLQEGSKMNAPEWNAGDFVAALNVWFQTDMPLVEIHTGRPVTRAFYVEVKERTEGVVVARVLA